MTTLYQTRCPKCHGYFSISESQHEQVNARGRCGRCKNVFLVNDYLDDGHLESCNNADDMSLEKSISDNLVDALPEDNIIPFVPTPQSKIAKQKYRDNPTHFKKLTFKNHSDTSTTVDNFAPNDHQLDDQINGGDTVVATTVEKLNPIPSIEHRNEMTADAPIEDDPEYESIDKMEVWLSQIMEERPEESLEHELLDDLDSHVGYSAPKLVVDSQRKQQLKTKTLATNNDPISIIKNDKIDNEDKFSIKKQVNRSNTDDDDEPENDLNQLLSKINKSIDDNPISDKERESIAQSRKALKQKRFESSIATAFWLAGCLVLALLLGAQYIIFNLDNLVKNPAYAARLQSFCSVLACSLPSADIDTLKVDNISYIPSNVNTVQGFSDIRATIINQNMQAQLLPNLKVSVYGSNAIIGEFIATPDKYVLSTEHQINAEQVKAVMFTVKVPVNQIGKVTIEPMY